MDRSQHSEVFSIEDASNDPQLTLTLSQTDVSSAYTPYIETEREKLIWGTTINIQRASERFKEFIRSRQCYLTALENMNVTQEFSLELDCSDLDAELKQQLEFYPQESIPIFESAVQEIYMEKFIESPESIKIRPFNIGERILIRSIDPSLVERIVAISGMVTRVSSTIPEIKRALYKCLRCERTTSQQGIKGLISEPSACDCGSRLSFELRHTESEYSDKQVIKIQELPEMVAEGTAPMTLTVVSRNDLVDAVVPGDTVEMIGVLKAEPVRINPHFKKVKSTFRIYIELLHVTVSKNKETEKDYLEDIRKLSKHPHILNLLSKSIAPPVFGLDNVKKGLILQLVGGVTKDLGTAALRGDINILLAGDPGISKSQLLGFVHRLSERGMYTSGKGSSAVGLTASVSKDVDSGQFILESGALVLSDNGICCIDEFDKMSEATRSVLHEVMEQQTVSLAKAGIITTLNARCAITASCNPVESKYNIKKTILENINLPPTLLSRFDLVCLLIDKAEDTNDKNIANHIVGMYTGEVQAEGSVSFDLLKAYLKEARNLVPVLSPESIRALADAYVDLRQLNGGESVSATTRQLESLIRLSEAHAKLRFSSFVSVEDVKVAVDLVKDNLLVYAVDPATGRIDVNMLFTGRTARQDKLIDDLKSAVLAQLRERVVFSELVERTGAEERLLRNALGELEIENKVYFDRVSGGIERI